MLTRPEPLGPHVVLFDGTRKAPMGRYVSPLYDPPAVDRESAVVPFRSIAARPLGQGASWRSDGPEAA